MYVILKNTDTGDYNHIGILGAYPAFIDAYFKVREVCVENNGKCYIPDSTEGCIKFIGEYSDDTSDTELLIIDSDEKDSEDIVGFYKGGM